MSELEVQKSVVNSGYLLVPRKLLNQVISQNKAEMSESQAFLSMLLLVNFKRTEIGAGPCNRGESLLRISEWSEVFRWPMWKTRRYFRKLEQEGEISIDKEKYPYTIRITRYEELCANKREHPGQSPKSRNDERFEEFWEAYHQITRQTPQEKEAGRREWNKLSARDKELAFDNIGDYFFSLRDIKHVRLAYNYLRCKSFRM